jgi:hypothetical protein
MPDKNRERQWQPPENDALDRKLDSALASYAAVEPRAGLAERILANLNAQSQQSVGRRWWMWGLAGAFAAILIMAVTLAWKSHGSAKPEIANHPAVKVPVPVKPETLLAANAPGNVTPQGSRAIRSTAHQSSATVPKLDQFPSPRPLSEQEKLALDYVQQFPEEAALIARAQTAFAQREELERNSLLPPTELPGTEMETQQ